MSLPAKPSSSRLFISGISYVGSTKNSTTFNYVLYFTFAHQQENSLKITHWKKHANQKSNIRLPLPLYTFIGHFSVSRLCRPRVTQFLQQQDSCYSFCKGEHMAPASQLPSPKPNLHVQGRKFENNLSGWGKCSCKYLTSTTYILPTFYLLSYCIQAQKERLCKNIIIKI